MARIPRPGLAGTPWDVAQYCNDRLLCFNVNDDRLQSLTALRQVALRYDSGVHVYTSAADATAVVGVPAFLLSCVPAFL